MNEVENKYTGSITSGGFPLAYQIEGNGHPTIVIGSSLYYPRIFSDNLRNHLRLIFTDHRGFAPSPGAVENSEFELEHLLDDVERLRQELKLGKIAVVGHSGHSFMALEYGKKYPQHTSHVVMIGISPTLSSEMMEKAELNWQTLASENRKLAEKENMKKISDKELSELPPDQAFIQSYVRNAARVWYNPRFDCTSLWEGITVNMDMIGYVWGELFSKIDVTEGLDNFKLPVFMALGQYDFIVGPPSTWDPITPLFNNLTIRTFDQSGHTPPFEEPELFDSELLNWMSQFS